MTELRDHPYITTFSGAKFRFDEPGPFILADIAHSLACTVRFRGHTVEPYYVAQHCVLVAREMQECARFDFEVLAGLLHDAHEAYVGDVPTPLKWACPEFKAVEDRVQEALRQALTPNIQADVYHTIVKPYDIILLHREATSLLVPTPDWAEDDGTEIVPWTSAFAAREFLRMARTLGLS